MPAKLYYDKDADISLLKNKTIAILGYGSQGHGHAQNLRDSGCNVIVSELPGTANYEQAVKDGFKPISIAEATKKADIVTILLPDELQAEIFRDHIRDNLSPGNVMVCSHGFNVHFGQFDLPKGVSTILVAPKGPGHLVRAEYVRGAGVPCLIALGEGAGPDALKIGLAYAKGIGGTRAGVMETTFAEETETDLFGEQVVLCGGLSADQGRLRNARRGRLSARNGLFRVRPRGQADCRPHLSGRLELHALQHFEHGRIWRLHPRPATRHRRDQGRDEADFGRDSGWAIRPRVDPGESRQRSVVQGHPPSRAIAPGRDRRPQSAEAHVVDQRQRSLRLLA